MTLTARNPRKKRKKRAKELLAKRSEKANGRRTTEEDRGWSSGRTRKEFVRLLEGERISLVDVVWSGAAFGCVKVWLQIMWVGLKRAGKQTPGRK